MWLRANWSFEFAAARCGCLAATYSHMWLRIDPPNLSQQRCLTCDFELIPRICRGYMLSHVTSNWCPEFIASKLFQLWLRIDPPNLLQQSCSTFDSRLMSDFVAAERSHMWLRIDPPILSVQRCPTGDFALTPRNCRNSHNFYVAASLCFCCVSSFLPTRFFLPLKGFFLPLIFFCWKTDGAAHPK